MQSKNLKKKTEALGFTTEQMAGAIKRTVRAFRNSGVTITPEDTDNFLFEIDLNILYKPKTQADYGSEWRLNTALTTDQLSELLSILGYKLNL